MISLYPSHIHISFPYPYISHIHKSFIIFACCPATCFFIFHFFVAWSGMCFSCGFLVSVLWMVFVPPFVPPLDPLSSFRFSPCPSFLSSTRFARFVLRSALQSAFRFVCSFGRVVEAVRAAVFGAGRLACRLAWRDVGAFGVCAVFVSSCSLTRFARLRSSRLFSSLLLLCSCSFRRACRMALRRNDAWLPRCGRYGLAGRWAVR